ncbi:MAG: nicotinamide riboside transporter PnuC [Bacteroidia bacterium]|nr:nicotinamide riboside transporter PnuC [Bacteroidia bacterium]
MISADLFQTFWNNVLDTSWLEIIAVFFGIASVWFAKKENILVYPTGILSVLIYVWICFTAKLYADAGINFYYFVTSVYGWYAWTHKSSGDTGLIISVNSNKQQWMWAILSVGAYGLIFFTLWTFKQNDTEYMQSYLPYTDSFTTAMFLIAMILMARKKVENWVYWIIGDVVSIPLYLVKGLVFTGFQYLVFLIIAFMGYVAWKRSYNEWRTKSVIG